MHRMADKIDMDEVNEVVVEIVPLEDVKDEIKEEPEESSTSSPSITSTLDTSPPIQVQEINPADFSPIDVHALRKSTTSNLHYVTPRFPTSTSQNPSSPLPSEVFCG